MRRLLSLLVVLLAAWLGLAGPAQAFGSPTSAQTYAYDGQHLSAVRTYTTTQRGPPASDARATTFDAVDRRLHGALARPLTTGTYGYATYDEPAILAQEASAVGTTGRPDQDPIRDLMSMQPLHVAANSARSAVQGSRVVSGRFPRNAGPDDILVRRGADGGVTNYQTYGPHGLPLKRIDVTGRAHGGVDTPHVVDFERHINPATGEVFVRPGSTVRPATPEELMGLD